MKQSLAEHMKAKGITDEKLGEMAGLSRSAVSRIRRGLADPPASTLLRIARALNDEITLDVLAAGSPSVLPQREMSGSQA